MCVAGRANVHKPGTQLLIAGMEQFLTPLGYFTKIQESQKLAKRKCPSSQIPFFTYKLLAELGF
jgi:hypothetical protein